MTSENPHQRKKMARVIAKAWADEGFKKRLLAEPAAVLGEEGLEIPEGITLRVVEDTPTLKTIVLPPSPDEDGGVEDIENRIAAAAFSII